jgi:hypothetical protein
MATVIPIERLRRSPSAVLFEGGRDVAVSVFVTEFERGHGPSLHVHPYPEVFLVAVGTALPAGRDRVHTTVGQPPAQIPA